jgi:hypothetical protein
MAKSRILHVVALRLCGPYSLELSFNDGVEKRVNLEPLLHRGVFRRLLDPAEFARARLDRKWGVVSWPGDLDFAPEALHELASEAKAARPRIHRVPAKRRRAAAVAGARRR